MSIWHDEAVGVLRYKAPQVAKYGNDDENITLIYVCKKKTREENEESELSEPCIWFKLSYAAFRLLHPAIEVRLSPLHGYGVFVKDNMHIKAQSWLAWYPGRRKLNDTSRFYEYGIGIGKYVWDARDIGSNNPNAIGHLVNYCHPMLPTPYNQSNATYICVAVQSPSKKGRYTVRAGVYAEHDIEGGTEILTDYHWFLDGVVHTCIDSSSGRNKKIVLRCDCDECVDLRRIRLVE